MRKTPQAAERSLNHCTEGLMVTALETTTMSNTIKAYAAMAPKAPLEPYEYEPGPLGDEQVEIAVSHCGMCHSDLSMWKNEWGMTAYPFVPGHEVVGKVVAVGENVKNIAAGQT